MLVILVAWRIVFYASVYRTFKTQSAMFYLEFVSIYARRIVGPRSVRFRMLVPFAAQFAVLVPGSYEKNRIMSIQME